MKQLRWCHMIPITSGSVSDGEENSSCCVFLYLQCWQTSTPAAPAYAGTSDAVKQPLKQEQDTLCCDPGAATSSASEKTDDDTGRDIHMLRSHSLSAYILHFQKNLVWSCQVESLEAIRPSYMTNRRAFFSVFESILAGHPAHSPTSPQMHQHHHHQPSSFLVFPPPPTINSDVRVVRVDIRLATRTGNASVGICSLHCSMEPCAHPVVKIMTLVAVDIETISKLKVESETARTMATQLELRMSAMTRKHIEDENVLLQGFVDVLNEKKRRIRQLSDQVEMLQEREVRLRAQVATACPQSMDDEGADDAFLLNRDDNIGERSACDSENDSDVEEVSKEAALDSAHHRKRHREGDGELESNVGLGMLGEPQNITVALQQGAINDARAESSCFHVNRASWDNLLSL